MNDPAQRSFVEFLEPMRNALRLHCYRMLGSSHDGDDAVQETFLRAWRARESLQSRETLKPWLYRIATNACLDELRQRPRRALASDAHPPTDPAEAFARDAIHEPVWLEPMPDAWLAGGASSDPAARYSLKESVALAFVAALQVLSPAQRATLLLRDVIGLSADETAEALGLSVSAANSALFRARTAVEEKLGGREPSAFGSSSSSVDEKLLAHYVRAYEEADVDALIALLHADARTTMPPRPTWIAGRDANILFYQRLFGSPMHARGAVRLVRSDANAQPAFGFYRRDPAEDPPRLRAIHVLTLREEQILAIDHFILPGIFPLFGLPVVLEPR